MAAAFIFHITVFVLVSSQFSHVHATSDPVFEQMLKGINETLVGIAAVNQATFQQQVSELQQFRNSLVNVIKSFNETMAQQLQLDLLLDGLDRINMTIYRTAPVAAGGPYLKAISDAISSVARTLTSNLGYNKKSVTEYLSNLADAFRSNFLYVASRSAFEITVTNGQFSQLIQTMQTPANMSEIYKLIYGNDTFHEEPLLARHKLGGFFSGLLGGVGDVFGDVSSSLVKELTAGLKLLLVDVVEPILKAAFPLIQNFLTSVIEPVLKVFLPLIQIFIVNIVQPLLSEIVKVAIMLIPVFNELVKLLSQLIKTLLQLVLMVFKELNKDLYAFEFLCAFAIAYFLTRDYIYSAVAALMVLLILGIERS
nr:movement protein [Recilia dorsalis filamentous virus]